MPVVPIGAAAALALYVLLAVANRLAEQGNRQLAPIDDDADWLTVWPTDDDLTDDGVELLFQAIKRNYEKEQA